MTPLRINGHRIPCVFCGRSAKAVVCCQAVCGRCLKAFAAGVFVGRMRL